MKTSQLINHGNNNFPTFIWEFSDCIRMGSYLSQPVTDKDTQVGEFGPMKYACTSMQGWRTEMEDSHIMIPNIGGQLDGISMFCVCMSHYFDPLIRYLGDGHGGREVARFVEKWLPKEAQRIGDAKNLPSTLILLYNRMDELLRDPEHKEELLSYRPSNTASSESPGGTQNSRAVSLLQGSIQSDLQELREKRGQVSRDEATQVMMKMMFLRRLEQQISSSDEGPQNGQETVNIADSTGCTAVTVLLTTTEILIANAGDSRAVLCRNGATVALSEDHKPNDPRESERIIRAGGTVEESQGGARTHYRVNGNLNLSRAIGDLEYKKNADLTPSEQMITSTPDIVRINRTPQDEFIVLGCDGVWDVLSNEDCVQFVRTRLEEGKSLRDICEEIADECLSPDPKATQGIGADNITCIIVDLRSTMTGHS
jgi:protein phosphatase 1G